MTLFYAKNSVKLPEAFKQQWLAALRSGNYSQTKDALRDDRGFCCLGVACDIYNPAQWSEPHEAGSRAAASGDYGFPGFDDIPLEVLTVLRQLEYIEDGTPMGNSFMRLLSVLNDDGKSFAEIADWIEENL
jgi:hypothetical protein